LTEKVRRVLLRQSNEGTSVLGSFLSIIFYDRRSTLRVLFKEMIKYLLAFFSGVVAVTSFVVASGARTSWLVVLGFVVATLFYTLLTSVIGAGRVARFLLRIAGERQPPQTRRVSAVTRKSEVEQDVISALIQQGASRRAAMRAAADATLKAPPEFEPLFRAAVELLH
jgi:hypothetical protein